MILICGKKYAVTFVLSRRAEHLTQLKRPYGNNGYIAVQREGRRVTYLTRIMEYCGGSQVDEEGHHVAGGRWSYDVPRWAYRYGNFYGYINMPEDLNVVGIQEVEDYERPDHGRFSPQEICDAVRIAGRYWRDVCVSCKHDANLGPYLKEIL